MTQPIASAELELYRPGATSPYAVIDETRIGPVESQERAEVVRDEIVADVFLDASLLAEPPRSGDRLEWTFDLVNSGTRRLTAMVRDVRFDQLSSDSFQLTLDPALDFVFSILSFRSVQNFFEQTPIGDILTETIANNAPEITLTLIGDFSEPTDLFADGSRLDDVVRGLIDRAGAFARSDGRELIIRRDTELPDPTTIPGEQHGTIPVRVPDDGVVNQTRVNGATDTAVDDSQETVSSFTTIGEGVRETVQVSTRKSTVAAVQIATDRIAGGGDLLVRVQKGENGAPVAVNDRQSDVVSETISEADVESGGGFTRLDFPDNVLPEPDPFLIIETNDGEQQIGVDGNGTPAYRVEFEFPVAARSRDQSSVERHRLRQRTIRKENVNTVIAARERAQGELRGTARPRFETEFEALGPQAFDLTLLDTVVLPDAPEFVSSRELTIIERTDSVANDAIRTRYTALDPETVG